MDYCVILVAMNINVLFFYCRLLAESEYNSIELLQVVHLHDARFLMFLVSFLSPQSSGLTTIFWQCDIQWVI